MTETRLKIIELIEPYMDKSLSEGCLIKYKAPHNRSYKYSKISIYYSDGTFGYQIERKDNKYRVFDTIRFCKISHEELSHREYDILKYYIVSHKIIGHYDITAVFDYINSINLGGIGPYYFDSIAFSKDYYILTPTGDNDYARIPRKPLHLYDTNQEKELLELLLKLNT